MAGRQNGGSLTSAPLCSLAGQGMAGRQNDTALITSIVGSLAGQGMAGRQNGMVEAARAGRV